MNKTYNEICYEAIETGNINLEFLGYGFGIFKNYETGKYFPVFTSKYVKNTLSRLKDMLSSNSFFKDQNDMMKKLEESKISDKINDLLSERYKVLHEKYPLIIDEYGQSEIEFETIDELCEFTEKNYGIIMEKEIWN